MSNKTPTKRTVKARSKKTPTPSPNMYTPDFEGPTPVLTGVENIDTKQKPETVVWNGVTVQRISGKLTIDDVVSLGKKLGEGKFGKVYRGIYIQDGPNKNNDVAVKQISVKKKGNIKTFVSEIKALQLAKDGCSKYVNEIYDVVFDIGNDDLYFIMEFLPGQDLGKYIKERKNKYFTEDEIRDYFTPLKMGLDCLHRSGIAHRDIKADNVMVDKNGKNPKWIDLGMSCIEDKTEEYAKCNGAVVGNLATMAPELLTRIETRTAKSWTIADMWSFGCLIYSITEFTRLPYQSRIIKTFQGESGQLQDFNAVKEYVKHNPFVVDYKTKYEAVSKVVQYCCVVAPHTRNEYWGKINDDMTVSTN